MNPRLGYALLRDRRISVRAKLIALGVGAAVVGVVEFLQIPFECVAAMFLPIVGITGDVAVDGAEALIGPVVVATLVLPYLVPASLVQQIRAERKAG